RPAVGATASRYVAPRPAGGYTPGLTVIREFVHTTVTACEAMHKVARSTPNVLPTCCTTRTCPLSRRDLRAVAARLPPSSCARVRRAERRADGPRIRPSDRDRLRQRHPRRCR